MLSHVDENGCWTSLYNMRGKDRRRSVLPHGSLAQPLARLSANARSCYLEGRILSSTDKYPSNVIRVGSVFRTF